MYNRGCESKILNALLKYNMDLNYLAITPLMIAKTKIFNTQTSFFSGKPISSFEYEVINQYVIILQSFRCSTWADINSKFFVFPKTDNLNRIYIIQEYKIIIVAENISKKNLSVFQALFHSGNTLYNPVSYLMKQEQGSIASIWCPGQKYIWRPLPNLILF